jgi:hypothetical protein
LTRRSYCGGGEASPRGSLEENKITMLKREPMTIVDFMATPGENRIQNQE